MFKTDNFFLRNPTLNLVTFAFLFYTIVSVLLNSPIFGSDEYAFFISGRFFQKLPEVYNLDPQLQRVSNLLYFKLLNLLSEFAGTNFVPLYKIMHAFAYIFTAQILYRLFCKIFEYKTALWGHAAFLFLPSIVYIHAIMPEIELMLVSSLVAYIFIIYYPVYSKRACISGGFLIGAALLLKPHGLAIFFSAVAFVIFARTLRLSKKRKRSTVFDFLLIASSTYLSYILIWRICADSWSFNPMDAFALNFYGGQLGKANLIQKIQNSIMYFSVHTLILTLIFSPAVVWIFATLIEAQKLKNRISSESTQRSFAALFVFLTLIINIGMTAWFSAGIIDIPGETLRLQGRYLSSAIAFLPFIYFYAVSNIRKSDEKAVRYLLLFALLISGFIIFENFRIFPWDYPLLFSFFKSPNHYNWVYETNSNQIGLLLLFYILLSWISMSVFSKHQKSFLSLQLFVILAVGCYQTYNWAFAHVKINNQITRAASVAIDVVKENSFGKGMFISDERYGSASYALFGLANSPRFLERKRKSILIDDDIKGVDWVLVENKYLINFKYYHALNLGPFTLFSTTNPSDK